MEQSHAELEFSRSRPAQPDRRGLGACEPGRLPTAARGAPKPASRPPPNCSRPSAASCPASSRTSARPRRLPGTDRSGAAGTISAPRGYIKPGLRLEQMSAAQKEAAWTVLATVWSPAGVAKAKNVMLLQDILAASGNGTRPALLAAFLALGLRNAGGDRVLGLALRGPSSHAVGRGARQPDRVGDAVFVFRVAQSGHLGSARRPQHAEGRGGPGAAALSRSAAKSCRPRARIGEFDARTTSCPMPGASAPTPRRSASLRRR